MKHHLNRAIKAIGRWYHTRKAKRAVESFVAPLAVNRRSSFTDRTRLGQNTNFNGMKIYGRGRVTIGDNFHSGDGCVIRTENHNHAGDALPYDRTYVTKDVFIGDNVWFGEGVMVLPGVTIGEGSVIQARSVVVSDIPPLAIAGGHPCRQFSARDEARYFTLKSERKFI